MITGKLYTYPKFRNIWNDPHHASMDRISFIEENEPFIFLEMVAKPSYESYKVLNSQGFVGWIHIGEPDLITEVIS